MQIMTVFLELFYDIFHRSLFPSLHKLSMELFLFECLALLVQWSYKI